MALQITDDPEDVSPMKDGPPCLQFLLKNKISEGGRNNGLFNIGVYLRKAYPDSWESEILTYNLQYLEPPLPLNEVNIVAKQLEKKDYAYRCSDSPINAHCNKELCQTRKHGIGAAIQGAAIANLRKYNSNPPVWFLDVNGEPVELDTEALMSQPRFRKCCMEQLNFMPRSVSKQVWEGRIGGLMNEMPDNESAIIDVAEDASTSGQFYDYLEEFCAHLQKANDKEEILLKRPWTDEETNTTLFRLKDFEAYLKRNKFFEYKLHKIAQRLRDMGGQSRLMKIKGQARAGVGNFDAADVDIKTPSFGRVRSTLLMKDRNDYIHEQRVVQLRTYQSIADEMGLSRERVRQIVVTVSQRIRWEQEIEALPDKPRKMCHLVLPRRVATGSRTSSCST